jgi:hypothetical protein
VATRSLGETLHTSAKHLLIGYVIRMKFKAYSGCERAPGEQFLHEESGTFYTMQVIIARLPEYGIILKKKLEIGCRPLLNMKVLL